MNIQEMKTFETVNCSRRKHIRINSGIRAAAFYKKYLFNFFPFANVFLPKILWRSFNSPFIEFNKRIITFIKSAFLFIHK